MKMSRFVGPAALLFLLLAATSAQAAPNDLMKNIDISAYSIYGDPCQGRPYVAVDVTNGNDRCVNLVGWGIELIDKRCPIQNVPVGLTMVGQRVSPCVPASVNLQWGRLPFNELVLIDQWGNRIYYKVPGGIDWNANSRVTRDGDGWRIEQIECEHKCVPCEARC